MAIMAVVLCGFSFYLGGIFCSENNKFITISTQKAAESSKKSAVTPLKVKSNSFHECSIDYQDYTPCTDPKVSLLVYYSGCLGFIEKSCIMH